jgi:ABC-type multidrug transport system ATPase subunit
MPLLRMRNASFRVGNDCVGPVTLDLRAGERAALACESARDATIVALLAGGIVKASNGSVLIDDYDPRVQSVNCKRIAALVPHEPFSFGQSEFSRYVAYRAALWRLDIDEARAHAARLRARLERMEDGYAFSLIAGLIGMPKLLVLDRPQPRLAGQIFAVADGRAILSIHDSSQAARAFT